VVGIFEECCTESMTSGNNEPKLRLFFKLVASNPMIIEHFLKLYPHIVNPIVKKIVVQLYSEVLRKKIPQNNPFVIEILEDD